MVEIAKIKLSLFLAKKDLFHDKPIFIMIIIAVMFGVGIQIPNTANLEGSSNEIVDRTVNVMTSHLIITDKNNNYINETKPIIEKLDEISWVKGYSERFQESAFLNFNQHSIGTELIGIEPSNERKITLIENFISEGRYLSDDDKNGTVLGDDFAKKIEADVGDSVIASFPNINISYNFVVIGLLDTGIVDVDEKAIFVSKDTLLNIHHFENKASEILIKTDDPLKSKTYRNDLEKKELGNDINILVWQEKLTHIEDMVIGYRTIKKISQIMTVIGVMVPVSVLMYVNVKNRKKEVGIMIATGSQTNTIFLIFLFEALIIATIGVFSGAGFGSLLVYYYHINPVVNRANFVIYPYVTTMTFLIPMVVIFIMTIVSGMYPAIKASKTDPIDAIWGK